MTERRIKERIPTEILHKEIDLIQGCISRMAQDSFNIRGWFISLATIAMTLLIGQDCKLIYAGVFLFVITALFWWLDGFFLKMETLYRWKYEWIIEERQKGNSDYLYDLNPANKNMWLDLNKKNAHLFKFMFSKTLIPLYGSAIMVAIVIFIYNLMCL